VLQKCCAMHCVAVTLLQLRFALPSYKIAVVATHEESQLSKSDMKRMMREYQGMFDYLDFERYDLRQD